MEMIYAGLYTRLLAAAGVASLLGSDAKDAIFFGAAPKEPPAQFVVINVLDAPPSDSTLDGSSPLIAGELQFDAYAQDNDTNTAQRNARTLARAVKSAFLDYQGPLSDGTTIAFTDVTADRDAGYEVGAEGYIFRSLVRMKAMYTEAA